MSVAGVVIVAAAGVGPAARFLLDGFISGQRQSPMPLGTLIINIAGSFLLGVASATPPTSPPRSWPMQEQG